MDQQTKPKKPQMSEILEWVATGRAKATDGCEVEPDGKCEHGCDSWLIVMEMI